MSEFQPVDYEVFKSYGVVEDPFLKIGVVFKSVVKQRNKTNKGTFLRQVAKEKGVWQVKQEALVENCFKKSYQLYLASGECPLKIKVLGRGEALRADRALKRNFGTIEEGGTILFMKKWSVNYNDAAILGAIHAKQTVYINPKPNNLNQSEFFDVDKGQPTVLGRETAMLLAAGYKIQNHDFEEQLGSCFVYCGEENASSISLKDLRKQVIAFKGAFCN